MPVCRVFPVGMTPRRCLESGQLNCRRAEPTVGSFGVTGGQGNLPSPREGQEIARENEVSIDIQCSQCGQTYRVPDEFAGKAAKCKKCENQIQIPVVISSEDGESMLELLPDAEEPVAPKSPVETNGPAAPKTPVKKKGRLDELLGDLPGESEEAGLDVGPAPSMPAISSDGTESTRRKSPRKDSSEPPWGLIAGAGVVVLALALGLVAVVFSGNEPAVADAEKTRAEDRVNVAVKKTPQKKRPASATADIQRKFQKQVDDGAKEIVKKGQANRDRQDRLQLEAYEKVASLSEAERAKIEQEWRSDYDGVVENLVTKFDVSKKQAKHMVAAVRQNYYGAAPAFGRMSKRSLKVVVNGEKWTAVSVLGGNGSTLTLYPATSIDRLLDLGGKRKALARVRLHLPEVPGEYRNIPLEFEEGRQGDAGDSPAKSRKSKESKVIFVEQGHLVRLRLECRTEEGDEISGVVEYSGPGAENAAKRLRDRQFVENTSFDNIVETPLAGKIDGQPFKVGAAIFERDWGVTVYGTRMTKKKLSGDERNSMSRLFIDESEFEESGKQAIYLSIYIPVPEGTRSVNLNGVPAIVTKKGRMVRVALQAEFDDDNFVNGVFEFKLPR